MSAPSAPRVEGLEHAIPRVATESVVVAELVPDELRRVLDVGCGAAVHTRAIAAAPGREVLALEVDERQHRKNLELDDLPNVRFELGGAERIPAADGSFDAVFLFKSLHHVPVDRMDAALDEVARVLRPGGLAYVSEPLFRDEFNEVLRVFHDERAVRRAAFESIDRAIARAALRCVSQTFFRAPLRFESCAEFERLVIGATHTEHRLDDRQLREVRARFARYADEDGGVTFHQPIRVDLLRRP